MTVFSGMLAATVIVVLVIPALFVLIEKITGRDKAGPATGDEEPAREMAR
jgi:hypothetical protein